ncbi:MAG: hypothetical protein KJ601_06630 [Nanoarchaeota archaeon]|nr:hypothetical protein [Nanoarchaeota archaeon]
MTNEKERLEQELRFLNESFEAEVITKDEYDKGRERIDNALNEIKNTSVEKKDITEDTSKIEKDTAEKEQDIEQAQEDKAAEKKQDIGQAEQEEDVEQAEEQQYSEESIEDNTEEPDKIDDEKEKETDEIINGNGHNHKKEEPVKKKQEPKKKPNKLLIILLILIIAYFVLPNMIIPRPSFENTTGISDQTKEPLVEPEEIVEAKLTIINDKDCKSCDSSRMEDTLLQLFNGAQVEYVEFEDASQMIEELGIVALPAYVFDSGLAEAKNFGDFNRALVKANGSYVLSNTASGANFFFKRKQVKNSLILYSINETEMASAVKEVTGLFGDDIKFEQVSVTEDIKEDLRNELSITSYPVFLINNQVKFSGIQSAESIKTEFCNWNSNQKCKEELTKKII